MFRLFLPNKATPSSTARQARPTLEALEDRYSPSSLTANITYGANQNVTITGQLTGAPSNAGQAIGVSGTLCGQTTTDVNGNYSITIKAQALGNFTVVAANPQTMQMDAQTTGTLVDNGPVISNFSEQENGQEVTFQGKVTDNWNLQGWGVSFGGAPVMRGQTTTVQADGTFTLVVDIPPGTASFTATAVTTDVWGRQSNTATTLVNLT
jgi:hypothetical protein